MKNLVKELVKDAMKSLKSQGGTFEFMTIPTLRDPQYQFDGETLKMVSEAGCELKWYDTMKGGCWHISDKN